MTRRGFTIVEMIVTVSVIAILLGLLLPALASVRSGGRLAGCQSNLRQIHGAATAYAVINEGRSPALGVPWGREPFWALVVQAYAGQSGEAADSYYEDSVLVSPAAVAFYGLELTRTYAVNVTGYAGAPGDRGNFDDAQVHIRTELVRRPSEIPYFMTSAVTDIDSDGPPPTRAASVLDFRDEDHVERRLGRYHGTGRDLFNAVRFDGSVELGDAVLDLWLEPLP